MRGECSWLVILSGAISSAENMLKMLNEVKFSCATLKIYTLRLKMAEATWKPTRRFERPSKKQKLIICQMTILSERLKKQQVLLMAHIMRNLSMKVMALEGLPLSYKC